jgi:hypothetical protein
MIKSAVQLVRLHGSNGRTFNAAMREEFPGITPHALRKAYQDAKILIAIERVRQLEIGE